MYHLDDRAVFNNLYIEALDKTKLDIKSGIRSKFEHIELTVDWVTLKNLPPMSSVLKSEKSVLILESDLPSYFGGKGVRPFPLQYFLYGLVSLFLSTLMIVLSEKNISVSKARAILKVDMNISDFLGLSDKNESNNEINGVLTLELECDIEVEKLLELISLAKMRCPAFKSMNIKIELTKNK